MKQILLILGIFSAFVTLSAEVRIDPPKLQILGTKIAKIEEASMSFTTCEVQDKIYRVENGLTPAIRVSGEPMIIQNIEEKMKEFHVPAASIAVINKGKIEWAKAYGVISSDNSHATNLETRFQAGSVSKPIAAYAILSLVNQHALELDQNVNHYLGSWQIPENEYTTINKVTLRHLLSHTSGCNVIGFDGYTQGEQLPTILQTLDGIKPANNPPVRVEFTPGSKMSYSGGGYNIAQQLVEDITKLPFSLFIHNVLLSPLKMHQSTFDYLNADVDANIAFAHPAKGIPMKVDGNTIRKALLPGCGRLLRI